MGQASLKPSKRKTTRDVWLAKNKLVNHLITFGVCVPRTELANLSLQELERYSALIPPQLDNIAEAFSYRLASPRSTMSEIRKATGATKQTIKRVRFTLAWLERERFLNLSSLRGLPHIKGVVRMEIADTIMGKAAIDPDRYASRSVKKKNPNNKGMAKLLRNKQDAMGQHKLDQALKLLEKLHSKGGSLRSSARASLSTAHKRKSHVFASAPSNPKSKAAKPSRLSVCERNRKRKEARNATKQKA